jgi:hypothetical protein
LPPQLGQSVLDLPEDRGVPVDHPPGGLVLAVHRGVLDQETPFTGQRGGGIHGLLVRALHHGHRGAFALDGLDPGAGRSMGNEDPGLQAEQAGHPSHRPPVVAVGGRAEGQGTQLIQPLGQLGESCPLPRVLPQPLGHGPEGRPRRAEDLEGGKSQASGLVLDEYLTDAEDLRETGRLHQSGRLVPRKLPVEVQGFARGRHGTGVSPCSWVGERSGGHGVTGC